MCVASFRVSFNVQCSRQTSRFPSGAEGRRLWVGGDGARTEREKAVHAKKRQTAGEGGAAPAAEAAPESGEPNAILFVQKLPDATTAAMLTKLFTQFPGFKEVRARARVTTLLAQRLDQPDPNASLALLACGVSDSVGSLCFSGSHGGGQAWHRVCGV